MNDVNELSNTIAGCLRDFVSFFQIFPRGFPASLPRVIEKCGRFSGMGANVQNKFDFSFDRQQNSNWPALTTPS